MKRFPVAAATKVMAVLGMVPSAVMHVAALLRNDPREAGYHAGFLLWFAALYWLAGTLKGKE